jgi:hypothetical protein
MYLAGVSTEGVTIKDVGSKGRKHITLSWEDSFDEGLLSGYIAVGRAKEGEKVVPTAKSNEKPN